MILSLLLPSDPSDLPLSTRTMTCRNLLTQAAGKPGGRNLNVPPRNHLPSGHYPGAEIATVFQSLAFQVLREILGGTHECRSQLQNDSSAPKAGLAQVVCGPGVFQGEHSA